MRDANVISRLKEWATAGLLQLHAFCVPGRVNHGAHRAMEASRLRLDPNDRVLVVAPHYDDEVIGCYHFIARYARACSIEIAFVTEDLDRHEYTIARRRESMDAIEPTGVADVQHWQLQDGDVSASAELLAEKLRHCNEHYDYILAPAPNDRTPDHIVIARIASKVCSQQKLVWYRSTWWTFSVGEADFFVSGSGSAKRRALRRFTTQGELALANAVSFSKWEAGRFGISAESIEAFQFCSSERLKTHPLNTLSMKSLLRLGYWK